MILHGAIIDNESKINHARCFIHNNSLVLKIEFKFPNLMVILIRYFLRKLESTQIWRNINPKVTMTPTDTGFDDKPYLYDNKNSAEWW